MNAFRFSVVRKKVIFIKRKGRIFTLFWPFGHHNVILRQNAILTKNSLVTLKIHNTYIYTNNYKKRTDLSHTRFTKPLDMAVYIALILYARGIEYNKQLFCS